jgi:glycerol-3-phosphate dehydrogenase (NAD(P)+)
MGGAVKNVIAIATGISDGMGFGANARSALIARGLAEMIRLGTALGAKQETLIGLSGLGDLILTCTDNQSRNRRFGLALASETQAGAAEREIGQVVEGKRNAEIVIKLAHKLSVEMPIVEAVWEVLQGKITATQAMKNLLGRSTKSEL